MHHSSIAVTLPHCHLVHLALRHNNHPVCLAKKGVKRIVHPAVKLFYSLVVFMMQIQFNTSVTKPKLTKKMGQKLKLDNGG
jgi:hypothetical protein